MTRATIGDLHDLADSDPKQLGSLLSAARNALKTQLGSDWAIIPAARQAGVATRALGNWEHATAKPWRTGGGLDSVIELYHDAGARFLVVDGEIVLSVSKIGRACQGCSANEPLHVVACQLLCAACDAETVLTCQSCGGAVEPQRRCYAVPTCYGCLPPPPPLESIPYPGD